jgi:hypothetical protein
MLMSLHHIIISSNDIFTLYDIFAVFGALIWAESLLGSAPWVRVIILSVLSVSQPHQILEIYIWWQSLP